ncbi:hypothetical protein DCAR_0103976 [Daucus carota subsp. sativus]|uniref:PC-Esterase n=1 Tax=Daucus carota subsp. sativus TaxID=79200 RepID=A0AAF0W9P5_DAUCS|nr:PREDICTED: uncharacterized protein LOC108204382 [Daucus carota subsp. sativus]WOG84791.1 hypothetical protein DCAR_0103976 [Daucus carota subsp. sativus]
MFGAVHFGIVAACVVLFVPMGLAGWHLSRNKVLFFSGILFIALFVGVHITPYFTSVSSFVNTFPSTTSSLPVSYEQDDRDVCVSVLHNVIYEFKSGNMDGPLNDSSVHEDLSWYWDKSGPFVGCNFQKLSKVDASDLLNGTWVVVAGDSQARLFVVSLLDLLLGPEKMEAIRGDLFKRHSNYQTVIHSIGLKLDFLWAPYAKNLTDIVMEFMGNKRYPDVLVIGAGLWDMLRITNSTEYGSSLQHLNTYLVSSLPVSPEYSTTYPVSGSVSVPTPHLFWLGSPTLINRMLNTEEKKVKMTDALYAAYEREMHKSKLLRQSAGPAFLLDIKSLSQKCGDQCTEDGMHYKAAVYETAVHIMLNALIIESQQKL